MFLILWKQSVSIIKSVNIHSTVFFFFFKYVQDVLKLHLLWLWLSLFVFFMLRISRCISSLLLRRKKILYCLCSGLHPFSLPSHVIMHGIWRNQKEKWQYSSLPHLHSRLKQDRDNNNILYIRVKATVTRRPKPNINKWPDFLELQKTKNTYRKSYWMSL